MEEARVVLWSYIYVICMPGFTLELREVGLNIHIGTRWWISLNNARPPPSRSSHTFMLYVAEERKWRRKHV